MSSLCVSVTVEVVTGKIITYSQDGAEMFCHPIKEIQRLAGTQADKAGVLYVHKMKTNNVKFTLVHCNVDHNEMCRPTPAGT